MCSSDVLIKIYKAQKKNPNFIFCCLAPSKLEGPLGGDPLKKEKRELKNGAVDPETDLTGRRRVLSRCARAFVCTNVCV